MIQGLAAGISYSYRLRVQAGDATVASRSYSFTTPGPDLTSFTFCAYGDTRSDPAAHLSVVKAMVACKPRLILHSGDLVEEGSRRRTGSISSRSSRFSPPRCRSIPAWVTTRATPISTTGSCPCPRASAPSTGSGTAPSSAPASPLSWTARRRPNRGRGCRRCCPAAPGRRRLADRHVPPPPYTSGPHHDNAEALRLVPLSGARGRGPGLQRPQPLL